MRQSLYAVPKQKILPNILSQADVILSAVGKPNFITEDMVRENCVLVDIGLSSLDGKMVGDISEGAKLKKAAAYTPVPGGVGSSAILWLWRP